MGGGEGDVFDDTPIQTPVARHRLAACRGDQGPGDQGPVPLSFILHFCIDFIFAAIFRIG